mgnify:CR=1 FL=1
MSLISKVNSLIYKVDTISNITTHNAIVSTNFVNDMINVTNHNVGITKTTFNYLTWNECLLCLIIIFLFILIHINTYEISQLKEKLKV